MAQPIALVTDSTCDIPEEWIKQFDIAIVPLTIAFGDQQYLDRVEMTSEMFYQRLPVDPKHPTTSQPTPKAFLEAFRRAAEKGAKEIITITISSLMSGTILSARQAAQESPIPVQVVDGRNNSMGLGWQVMAAARAQEAGGGLDAMLAAAEQARKAMVYYVSLDTIEYLSRGGRISEAANFLSSILNIKPLIYVRPDTGTVAPSIPSRSRKNALESLFREFFRHFLPGQTMHLTVLHNGALEEAQQMVEKIRGVYSPKELFITITSPVLGAHTGPRAVAIVGYADNPT